MIKLFESINGGYEAHFIKKQGEYMDYCKHFEEIKNIIKDYLKVKKESYIYLLILLKLIQNKFYL